MCEVGEELSHVSHCCGVNRHRQMHPNDHQEVNGRIVYDPTEQPGSPVHPRGFV